MNFFFIHNRAKKINNETNKNLPVTVPDRGQYLNEGGEFLDDTIHMDDEPQMNTEENIESENQKR